MSDRRDFYYRQKVTEGELDSAFDGLEAADRNMVADLGFTGVSFGLAVTQHAGTPDLTVDISAGCAYDPTGQRIRTTTTQTISLATDTNSVVTSVGAGNARVVSLFAVFARSLSDPRVDGNSNTVYFVRAESFAFRVVAGNEATLGTEVAPALAGDAILLADVKRLNGQTQIVNANINPYAPNRAQIFAFGVNNAAVNALITTALVSSPTISNPTIGGTVNYTATVINATGNTRGQIYTLIASSLDTSSNTITNLFTWTILDNAVTTITVEISAIKDDGTASAFYQRRLRIRSASGVVTLGSVDLITSDPESGLASVVITLDNSGSTGRIRVTGLVATNINWFGIISRIEHSHP